MEQYQEEREIDLKQLFLTILAKWRVLLLCGVIGMLLGTGYQFFRSMQTTQRAEPLNEKQAEEQELPVNQEYAGYIEEIENYNRAKNYYQERIAQNLKTLEQQTGYLQNSILTTLDPDRVTVSRASIIPDLNGDAAGNPSAAGIVVIRERESEEESETDVTVAGADTAGSSRLLSAYHTALSGSIDLSEAAKAYETEPCYLAELITIEKDLPGGCLNICVFGAEEDMSEALLDAVLEQVEARQADVTAAAGAHTVKVLRAKPCVEVNRELFQARMQKEKTLEQLRSRLDATQKALDALKEPAAPRGVAAVTVQEEGTEEETVYIVRDARTEGRALVKYALIGFFGGLFLSVFLYAIYYVLSGRVLSADELNRRYRLKAISVLAGNNRGGIDGKLALLGNDRDYLQMPEQERIRVAASNFLVYAPDVKDVVLTGSLAEGTLQAVAKLLGEQIADVHFTCASRIHKNAASLEALKGHEHVILVEQVLGSSYGETDREIQLLADWGKTIIGSLVLYAS